VAAGFEIAEGYLEINADVDGALTDVRKFFAEVDGELKAEEKAFAKSGEKSGSNYAKAIGKATPEVEKTFRGITEKALKAAEDESSRRGGLLGILTRGGRSGRGGNPFSLARLLPSPSILKRLTGGLRSAFSGAGNLLGDLFKGGKSLFKGITTGISEAFSTGFDQAKQIWENVSGAFQKIGGIASGIGGAAQAGGMALLIPVAIGLAGALTQLAAAALAAPAALGVLAAAIAPLVVAFKGFGEAVSAGLSGDVDQFNEALKHLAPNAQKVAKEFVKLGPALSKIKQQTQNAFFGPLVGQLGKLGTTLFPALATGMSLVAGELGRLVKLFVGLLSAPDTISMINDLFATTGRIVHEFAEPFVNFLGGVFDLIKAGLPWVERFAGVLANGLQAGANWLEKISAPGGKLGGWLERAWDIGKKLWNVLKGVGEFAFTLLNSFGDEGTDTLNGMGNAIAKVNEYLKSKDGQETLHNLGVLIHWAGNAMVFLIENTTNAYKGLNKFFAFIRGIGPFFSKLGSDIADIAKAIGHWFANLWRDITGGVSGAASSVGGFFAGIGRWFASAWDSVVSFGGMIIDWFAALPGRIWGWIKAIPGMLVTLSWQMYDAILFGIGYLAGVLVKFWLHDLPGWIVGAWNWAVSATQAGATAVMTFLSNLPRQIGEQLSALGDAIGGWFGRAWDWAVAATISGWNTSVEFTRSLPGRIWDILSALGDAIGGWFTRAWNWAVESTKSGVHSVLDWFYNLPKSIGNALSGAGSWLYNAGKDILRGLVDGLRDTLGWAVERARHAASEIKKGFLDALGIASPSQVMRMEVGRWILPGVMQGIDDTKPRFDDYLGASADMIRNGYAPVVNVAAPSVSVGGTTLLVDLGDGIRQAVPVQIMRNPATVSNAAQVGDRRRAGWVNTGRTTVGGSR